MPNKDCPSCTKCGCAPRGYLELFETVSEARCQHCQQHISVREMSKVLDTYSDDEIMAEGFETGRMLCEDDLDLDDDYRD
ncbi:MAG: hypothetical protein ACI84O_000757 [Myxococcota bacterium]|jgi:hypothetical protein